VPTDEEFMIAKHTLSLLSTTGGRQQVRRAAEAGGR
jgi:hypothetical protein